MTGAGAHALLDKADSNVRAALLLLQAGHLDAAVSRAYYAMFYAAEALLAELGQSYSKHAGVIAAFGREYAKPGILDPSFHRWLIDAQDLRSMADYTAADLLTVERVQTVCDQAREFVDAARRHLANGMDDE